MEINYIRCHGSGNRFLLLDAAAEPRLEALADRPALIRRLCRIDGPTDGLLLTVRRGALFGMRMFNTDGSEAEMCGNGIRCVARQVSERYLSDTDAFELLSGGRRYPIRREEPIFADVPTYRVELPIRLATADFPPSLDTPDGFVGRPLEALDPDLRFTYVNPGNPHLAAAVEHIDTARLVRLGERVKELPALFPRGINVSLFIPCGGQEIRTATYERGVGLTSSCGTAMTSASTAACFLQYCRTGLPIRVRNDGGMVRCLCHRDGTDLVTSLSGNATFEADGRLLLDPGTERAERIGEATPRTEETDRYRLFYESVQR